MNDFSNHPAFAEIPDEPKASRSSKGSNHDTVDLMTTLAGYGQHDTGNGHRLTKRYGDDVIYCEELGWHIWNGAFWEKDQRGRITSMTQDMAERIRYEATYMDLPDKNEDESEADYRERCEKIKAARRAWADKSLSARAIKAAQDMAKPHVAVAVDEIDGDDWNLVVKNGTLDLRTGELRAHDRSLRSTKHVDITYNPKADCPTWKKILNDVFLGDQQLVDYFQRAAGYALTGDTSEQAVFIAYGNGANGKSTIFNVLQRLAGSYSQAVGAETLMDRGTRQAGGPSPDLARLKGIRCAVAMESRRGEKLDEETIKALTGGDRITARHLHGNLFDFHPKMKIFMGTNHKPRIDGVDHGIWRRVKLLPFEATFVKTDEEAKQTGCVKRTEGLTEAIDTEIEGILAWAVEGCLAWQNEGGLKDPEAVRAATEEYRSEMDRLSDFLSECVERKPAVTVHEGGKEKTHNNRIPARDLYEAYIAYCYRNAEKAVTLASFGKMMRERGFDVVKSNGKKYDGVAMTKIGEEFLQVYHAMHSSDRRDTVSG